jgi:glucose-6-phosphate isomerase
MEGPFDKIVTFVTAGNLSDLVIPEAEDIPDLAYLGGQSLADLLHSEQKATAMALARAGRPNCTIHLSSISPESVGALMYMFEVQTVFSGALFDVNPLDQPGVESGKMITSALMGRPGFERQRKDVQEWETGIPAKLLKLG